MRCCANWKPGETAARPCPSCTGAAPEQMLQAVGYYGPAAAAPAAFARLSAGLDEAIVRVITARPGLEPVIAAMAALTPALYPGRRRRSRLTRLRSAGSGQRAGARRLPRIAGLPEVCGTALAGRLPDPAVPGS